ncbi:MAG TPA: Ig-like domain-containing protein [Prosthecobacter sp.]
MKKLFSILGCCLMFASASQGATITISNYSTGLNGVHGIADAASTRLGGATARGTLGRMNGLTESQVADLATAGNITALNAAFQPFGDDFALDSLGAAGAFESEIFFDTHPSVRPGYGGSPIYVWMYKGTSRTSSSEYLLVRLTANFPTDSDLPSSPINVYVRPDNVAQVLAGTTGGATFDYGLGGGAFALYQTISTSTSSNVAPVASNGTLNVFAGIGKSGQLSASDANSGDTLTYSRVTAPTKGQVTVETNGSYVYVANADQLGTDTFTFKANDGTADSNIATITVTIEPPPPNTAPVAQSVTIHGQANDVIAGVVTASDADGDSLTFVQVGNPTSGTLTSFDEGSFTYRPNAGFVGTDSFTFKVNDGLVDSALATVTLVVEQGTPSWTWIGGDNLPKQRGVYTGGTLKPGARTEAASASTSTGISYHFGGSGYGTGTKVGALNDLWKYDSAGAGTWSHVSGGTDVNAMGVYGTKGEAAAANVPGARSGALLWVDAQENIWLFGGAASATSLLNDLWKYNKETSQWTWISGGSTANGNGVYGERGTEAAANVPGARTNAVGWTDFYGRLWVFGGKGLPASGTKAGSLNDLWVFDPGTGGWTWLSGSSTLDAIGVYGSLGASSSTFTPGARSAAAGWSGADGNLWLFGGNGRGNSTKAGNLNDLWKYDPRSNEWSWTSGSAVAGAAGVYGNLGQPAAANVPSGRAGAAATLAADGSLLLFGGLSTGHLNDLWRYNPEDGLWTWLKGASTVNGAATYGQLGVSSPTTTPGSRRGASAFTDATGNLLLFAGTNGANSNNDVWELGLSDAPVVYLTQVTGDSNTTATVQVSVHPNGSATTATLHLVKLATGSEEIEMALDAVPAGNQAVTLTELVTDLDPASTYAVYVEAQNAFGTGRSRVGQFFTTGTAVPLVAQFESAGSTQPESAGTVQVEVTLSTPTTAPFSLPFSVTGSASRDNVGNTGDFALFPASDTLQFLPGQLSASISISLRDDAVQDAENIILTLGTPSDVNVTVGSAGVYTLTIEDNDSAPQIVETDLSKLIRLGTPLSLNGTATGAPVITYAWTKDTKAIAKATQPVYTLPVSKLTDAGSYRVEARNALGNTSATFDVGIVDASSRTVIVAEGQNVSVTVPAAGTGLTYQWYKGEVALATQTTATLSIPGAAVADSGNYTCAVTKGDDTVTTGNIQVSVYDTVIPPPAFLAGNYVGLVDVEADAAPLGGRFDVTVTTKGAYTAKLTLGTTALTAKGQLHLTAAGINTVGSATASFVRKGLPNVTVQFSIVGGETIVPAVALQGTLDDPATGHTADVEGYRNGWVAKTNPATGYEGSYTYILELPESDVGVLSIPQGDGFGALTVTATGTASFVGRTADGGKFTVATIVSPTGRVPFYSGFTPSSGCLQGTAAISLSGSAHENNTVGGTQIWKKLPVDAKSKDLAYRDGFGPLSLNLRGGKWKAPEIGGVIAGLPNEADNAVLNLVEGGALADGINAFTFSIRNLKTTGVVQTVVIDKTKPNPNSVTFKLIAKPVGHFSGTFVVPNPVKTLVRSAAYQGTFVHTGNGQFISGGFFLLAQPPEPGQTVKTSPQLSGQVHIPTPVLAP